MENSRLNDMLARYGEVCTQKAAAQILNIVPRTVARMCDEGRLRRVGHRVDVRSIYEYIVNPRNNSCYAERSIRNDCSGQCSILWIH